MIAMFRMLIGQRKQVQSLYDEGLLPGYREKVRGIDTVQDFLGLPAPGPRRRSHGTDQRARVSSPVAPGAAARAR